MVYTDVTPALYDYNRPWPYLVTTEWETYGRIEPNPGWNLFGVDVGKIWRWDVSEGVYENILYIDFGYPGIIIDKYTIDAYGAPSFEPVGWFAIGDGPLGSFMDLRTLQPMPAGVNEFKVYPTGPVRFLTFGVIQLRGWDGSGVPPHSRALMLSMKFFTKG